MKYFFLVYTFLVSMAAFGQLTIEVRDEHTDQPIEGAHVSLHADKDSTYLVTGANGKATFTNQAAGTIKISHVAFLPTSAKATKSKIIYLTPLQTGLDEVVVTGHARPVMASQSVRTIRVIGSERIEQQAAVNLKDLLTNDLNFRISEDAVLGSQLSLQGLSGSKIKILIDGVPVIGRLDGNIDLSQINLNDIERVEVVEGPMAVQYGTDAMAGTINLITKRKATNNVSGTANGYYESVGRYNIDGSVSFPVGKFQANVGVGRNYFAGYSEDENLRNVPWNPKEQYFANASLQRRFSKVMARYRLDYFDEEIVNKGEPYSAGDSSYSTDGGTWHYPLSFDDSYKTLRINNALYADYYPREDMKVKAFVAYNYYQRKKSTIVKNLTSGSEKLAGTADAQDTSVFTMLSSRMFYQHDWLPEKLNYQVGYDLSFEENAGQRIEGEVQNITDLALFATAEYKPVKKVNIQPGLRYAYNSRFDAPLIASLATRVQLSEKYILRASFGQGFRAPSLKELYFHFVDANHQIFGNGDLVAETSNNYQLSLSYAQDYPEKDARVEASVSGFFNDIKNEIRLIQYSENSSGPLYRNENVARTQTTGGTLSMNTKFAGWHVEGGVSMIGVKNNLAFADEAETDGFNEFNFYAQFRLNADYLFKKINLRPALFFNHFGERQDLQLNGDSELEKAIFEGYTMADFTLQKGLFSNKVKVTAGIKNIFDVTQISTSSVNSGGAHRSGGSTPLSYGRTYFAQIQWTF